MKLRKTYLTSVVLALFVTGCTTSQTGEDSAKDISNVIDVPDSWGTKASTAEVSIDWLNDFKDPLLLVLIDEGKANNLDLQSAAGNVEKAWVLANQAGAALQPVANLSLGDAVSGTANGTPSINRNSLTTQISWELDIWGRIRASSRAAVQSARSAEADYKYALHSLSANIAKAYFIVIEAKSQADVSRKNQSILKRTLRIVNVQFENGLATAQDVSLSRSKLASAEENLLQVEASKREAVRSLELLLGRYPNAELELPDILPVLPPSLPAGLPSAILERRPDIIAAERKLAAAFDSTDAAQAAALPSFSLTGSIGGSSADLSKILDPANVAWQLAANLMVPIFDQGAIQSKIKVANIEQKQALNFYVKTALDAFSDVETLLDQGNVLDQREKFLIESQRQINNAYRIANLRYQEGEIELLDVLTLQQQAISADSNSVAIKRALLDQRVNLYLALGGAW